MALYVGWRCWRWFEVTDKVIWGYQRVRDFMDTVESVTDAYEQVKIEYEAGNLDWMRYICFASWRSTCS